MPENRKPTKHVVKFEFPLTGNTAKDASLKVQVHALVADMKRGLDNAEVKHTLSDADE